MVAVEGTPLVSCVSCHGVEQSAHRILPTGNPNSTINHFAISDTCGKCHEEIKQEYSEGIHGQWMLRGQTKSPTCTNCHGEHTILPTSDSRSRVSPAHLAESTCIPCHQSAALSEQYDIPSGEPPSFIDPYHGLKGKSDRGTVATCFSCHEAHRILPHTNPQSTVHPDNLQKTCGACHEDISYELANTPIHFSQNVADRGWPLLFRIIYYLLISVTLTAMVLYIALDLWRHWKNVIKQEQVPRMTRGDILQHSLLFMAFTVLVLTGFALRFSDSWWAHLLFGKTGMYSERGLIHRTAGVVLMLTSLMHLVFLKSKNGKDFLKQMLPGLRDFKKLWGMLRYNLGLSGEKPALGKFTYVEKFEYWALIWGTIIISITGIILWFDNIFIHYLSRTVLDVVRVIHYYEAWLATLSILVWHLYATIFNPGIYPMNPAWITGTMPKNQYQHEHGDP
jgi:formate dehydrogenase gamma subunit